MPKKTPYAVRKSPAATLIEKQKGWGFIADPSPEALVELKALLTHNDAATRREKVPCDDAIEMLRGLGWTGTSRKGIDALCIRLFGRRSYGTR